MMDTLPIEVLGMIFAYVDDKTILNCELVCRKWKEALEREQIFAKKCERILKFRKTLLSTYDHQSFHTVIQNDRKAVKKFYFKIKNLRSQWQNQDPDQPDPGPMVINFQCKTGEVSEEWIRKHNYTGIYDMVWLPDKSYLICSCYDTIQVWNMVNYTRVSIFEGHLLDSKDEKATCFYGCGPALVTGTSLGRLQAYDLLTRDRIGQSEILSDQSEMFSDIKGKLFRASIFPCVNYSAENI